MRECKVVVVGSGGVGKSCVTIQFLKKKFAEYYDPTIEESYRKQVTLDGKEFSLEIVDTAGQEEFASFRDSSFQYGDGFLLVLSITSISSFKELQDLYGKVMRVKDTDKVPVTVIGNKADLEDERTVTREDILAWTEKIGVPYFDTSAKTGLNVDEAFHSTIREIERLLPQEEKKVEAPKQKKKKCEIL
eukprot:Clim_evm16s4 gene=Clim_evmTU16s4